MVTSQKDESMSFTDSSQNLNDDALLDLTQYNDLMVWPPLPLDDTNVNSYINKDENESSTNTPQTLIEPELALTDIDDLLLWSETLHNPHTPKTNHSFFPCNECDEVCTEKHLLRKHLKVKHNYHHNCDFCSAVFSFEH
jgi:hypothetical protein